MKLKPLLAYPRYQLFGYRPVRVPAAQWDREFRSGKWAYLNDIRQIGCLSIVFSYCQLLVPGSILDVGCGSGSLTRSIRLLDYEYYQGIDLSAEAIAQAEASYAEERTTFAVANAETFEPRQSFDLIIFNNCLYYFEQPDQVAHRYAKYLNPSGHVVVSMSDGGLSRAVWTLVEKNMAVEHAIRVVQADGGATTKLLRPL